MLIACYLQLTVGGAGFLQEGEDFALIILGVAEVTVVGAVVLVVEENIPDEDEDKEQAVVVMVISEAGEEADVTLGVFEQMSIHDTVSFQALYDMILFDNPCINQY